jgi:flagellar hook assembly protein FlgD
VSLSVYDVNGRLVKTLVDEDAEAGTHLAVWDGTDSTGHRVARGIYFCRMAADEFSATAKVVLLK